MRKIAFLDKPIKDANLREVVAGHGFDFVQPHSVQPRQGDLIAVHGVLRGNGDMIRQANENQSDWLYVDNGYLGKYKRVLLNSTAPRYFRKGRRFEHDTQLQPWRGGSGSKIILLPPSPPYMDTFGSRDFLNEMAHSINIHTGKDIIVRAKPAKGRLARPWRDQLEEAYCVVTWGSALALDAMIMGVPTISLGDCPAKFASKKLSDLETNAMMIEPPRMEIIDSLTWSSFDKNELGKAYNIVKENEKHEPTT